MPEATLEAKAQVPRRQMGCSCRQTFHQHLNTPWAFSGRRPYPIPNVTTQRRSPSLTNGKSMFGMVEAATVESSIEEKSVVKKETFRTCH